MVARYGSPRKRRGCVTVIWQSGIDVWSVFRAPGRAGTAHVVLFGMVGVERHAQELAPETCNRGQCACRRRGRGKWAFCNRCAVCRHGNLGDLLMPTLQLWVAVRTEQVHAWQLMEQPLKSGFLPCCAEEIPVDNLSKILPKVALCCSRRYIRSSKIPSITVPSQGSRWLASSSTSCRA